MTRTYTTQLGDMWDGIAFRVYDDRRRAEMLLHRLIEANPEHRETSIFSGGITLFVPDVPIDMPVNLPPWKR